LVLPFFLCTFAVVNKFNLEVSTKTIKEFVLFSYGKEINDKGRVCRVQYSVEFSERIEMARIF
jgi:hypothetical protein